MKRIETPSITPGSIHNYSSEEQLWLYCGMDSMLPHESIRTQIDLGSKSQAVQQTYAFHITMQGPALSMMLRGLRVNQYRRAQVRGELIAQLERLKKHLGWLVEAATGMTMFNPRSSAQVIELLYERLKLPPQYSKSKGEKKLTGGREALEKLRDYWRAEPIINHILAVRDTAKMLDVVNSGLREDGRMHYSFNIGGTETGRWSSSEDIYGKGLNIQNVTDKMREIFIADPGFKLAYCDLSQAESRVVAYRSGDAGYISACESGDLHTYVARMLWPRLAWTGDLELDKPIADEPYYRHFSYRDISKRGGHAINYYAKPSTLSRHLKIDLKIAEEFSTLYHKQFPGIPRWHQHIASELQTSAQLTTILNRRRIFFDRLNEDSTLREAIAFEPQSVVGDLLNRGLLACWRELELNGPCQMLAQIHDAILFQYPEGEDKYVDRALELMTIPLTFPAGIMRIPVEAKVGYTWRKEDMALLHSPKANAQIPPREFNILDVIL